MLFDESDSNIELEYLEILKEKNVLEQRITQLKIFERRIMTIKKIDKTIRNDRGINEVIFLAPTNPAGNDMDENYRTSMKTDLIVNIQALKSNNEATTYYQSEL